MCRRSSPATLARDDFASQQALDQATNDAAAARADVAEAEANRAAAVAGPTKEERLIADAEVQAAAAALAVLERHLGKTVLRSTPRDGHSTSREQHGFPHRPGKSQSARNDSLTPKFLY
jgi:multidrug resistance efflux pump